MNSNKPKLQKILDRMDAKDSYNRIDRALFLLLERYFDDLPEYDEDFFHKSFRQIDVVGDSAIDMVIWHLLFESKGFWRATNEL